MNGTPKRFGRTVGKKNRWRNRERVVDSSRLLEPTRPRGVEFLPEAVWDTITKHFYWNKITLVCGAVVAERGAMQGAGWDRVRLNRRIKGGH